VKIFGVKAKEMSSKGEPKGHLVETDLWQLHIRKWPRQEHIEETHLSLYLKNTRATLARSFTPRSGLNLEVYQREIEDRIHRMLEDHSRALADVYQSMPSGARGVEKPSTSVKATKAYLALGEALKGMFEQHEQLEAYQKSHEAIADMNMAENLAALHEGIPPREDIEELEGFRVGDYVGAPNYPCWRPIERLANASVEVAGHRWLPSRLARKPVEIGDTVRVKNSSFTGCVKTIQRNEIGTVVTVWFQDGRYARARDCIAVSPSSVKT